MPKIKTAAQPQDDAAIAPVVPAMPDIQENCGSATWGPETPTVGMDARDEPQTPPAERVPKITDVDWSEYVIDRLDPTEIDERGSVTTDGLRRIAPLLLGKFLRSGPSLASVPSSQNGNRATVLWEIRYLDEDGEVIIVSDIAGVTLDPHNRYSLHAEASAATKAEGRALKKALRLRRIYTTEEMAESNASSNGGGNGGDLIALTQLRFIENKCEQLDIDAAKFIKSSGHGPFSHYNQVPAFVAGKMIKTLDDWQRDTSKIPEDVKGFDVQWRKSY